jgi:hypothetical protein
MSDGYSDVSEAVANAPEGHYNAYCFYHGQDVARAIDCHGLMIAFGALDDDPAGGIEVGRRIAQALSGAGFDVAWNGSFNERIGLPKFVWQRRAKG